jgi:hypothetical protein
MEGGNRQPLSIRDLHGRWYSLRILPSVGPDGKTDGAVLMLIDIDAAKRGLDFAEAIVETVREPLVILNQNLRILKANKTFYESSRAIGITDYLENGGDINIAKRMAGPVRDFGKTDRLRTGFGAPSSQSALGRGTYAS